MELYSPASLTNRLPARLTMMLLGRAAPPGALGTGAERNLAGSQGPSTVLSGAPVVAGQGGPRQTRLADVPGAGLRRPDGSDRTVTGRTAAAGDERPRHSAVARLADDGVAH